jgi:hypothetical protein
MCILRIVFNYPPMAWHTTELILKHRMRQHGLSGIVEAGSLCMHAEALYPEMFRAVSVRNSVLHLRLSKAKTLPFKMIEGLLMEQLNAFAAAKRLPLIRTIRLTFGDEVL